MYRQAYVEGGIFELTIDGVVKILNQGGSYFAPLNIVHSSVCRETGVLVDMFVPMREDFLK